MSFLFSRLGRYITLRVFVGIFIALIAVLASILLATAARDPGP